MTTAQYSVIALVAAIALLAVFRFELLCFRDLAQRDDAELVYLSRSAWIIAIACAIPLGGIFYLFYGRPH